MKKEVFIPYPFIAVFSWALILSGLYLTSLYSYLLFHSLAEIFSIVVACGIFMIAWNSRQFLENNYLLFIGIAYLFVGGLDLLHTLAYKGMGVFQGDGANLPTQLWLAARYMESLSLLVAPLVLGRKLKSRFVVIGYSLVFFMLLTSIFYWRIFPDCFVEGVGLTPFKKWSEYIICLILASSVVLVVRKKKEFDKVVLQLLVASILLTIAAELAFTIYISVYGISNLFGHFCKILSFYLIYKAIIQTGLTKPYDLLFRNLKHSEEALREKEAALRESHLELERRVEERTADLMKANEQLEQEIEERRKVEGGLAERIRLEALRGEVGVALAKGDNLRSLLQPCTEASVEHLGAAFARIWTYNEGEKVLELQASAGLYTRIDGSHSRVAMGESKVGIIAQECQPLITNAVIGDPQIVDQEWAKRTGMMAFAGYPLIFANELVGVMAMFGAEAFGEFTLNALASVADQIALGIQRQRAEEALRKSGEELKLLSSQLLTAQETERGRIARELHDGIGQSLSAIKFRVEDALGQLEKGSTESSVSTLGNLIPIIQSTVEEVRRITMDLRPSTLDDLGILATIAWLCRVFQATYSTVEIKREIGAEESDIPNPLKIVVYRILQEALNNVAKHSGADMVTISLAKKDNTIKMAIEDNGCGFDIEEAFSVESSERGFGLASMKERTELSGGTFVIDSAKGEGTIILASWLDHQFRRRRAN
jgi:signal transduction histidine kinase